VCSEGLENAEVLSLEGGVGSSPPGQIFGYMLEHPEKPNHHISDVSHEEIVVLGPRSLKPEIRVVPTCVEPDDTFFFERWPKNNFWEQKTIWKN